MKRLAAGPVVAVAVLMLAGCGSSSDDEAAGGKVKVEEAARQAAKLERPQPGQYRQTMEITKFEVPGMTEKNSAQFKAMLAKVPAKTYCLTEEDAGKGFKNMLDKLPGDNQCSYSKFDVDGGKLDAQMECKDASGEIARARMAGTIGPQGSDVKLDMEQPMPGMAGKTAIMSMHMTTTRLGDCDS
jgi:hypothetical protein